VAKWKSDVYHLLPMCCVYGYTQVRIEFLSLEYFLVLLNICSVYNTISTNILWDITPLKFADNAEKSSASDYIVYFEDVSVRISGGRSNRGGFISNTSVSIFSVTPRIKSTYIFLYYVEAT
jgi:hypothetical protein